jgi:hypothetical protein
MSTQNAYKKNAIIVGILFIIATAFLFIGEAFYGPILNVPDFLETAYPNRITAIIGTLIEFTCVLAIPLIPVSALFVESGPHRIERNGKDSNSFARSYCSSLKDPLAVTYWIKLPFFYRM